MSHPGRAWVTNRHEKARAVGNDSYGYKHRLASPSSHSHIISLPIDRTMAGDERILTSLDGTNIWAEAAGDPANPAVVFIPGLACSALLFDKQFQDQALLDKLYLVRYELRGHGRSGTPEGIEAYAGTLQAEDFRAVCEAFQLRRPWVYGWWVALVSVMTLRVFIVV